MKQILTEKFIITGADCDAVGLCKPTKLLQALENVAKQHASSYGAGMEEMKYLYNAGWMILRTTLEITAPIRAGDTLEISTWSRGARGAADYRDYRITRDGVKIGTATELWILTELTKRQILELGKLPALQSYQPPKEVYTQRPAKLFPVVGEKHAGEITVQETDIDTNGHMNNVKYVSYALQYLPDRLLPETYILELNYCKEVLCGGQLSFSTACERNVTTLTASLGEAISFLLRLKDIG